jgi:hypothetical protein
MITLRPKRAVFPVSRRVYMHGYVFIAAIIRRIMSKQTARKPKEIVDEGGTN